MKSTERVSASSSDILSVILPSATLFRLLVFYGEISAPSIWRPVSTLCKNWTAGNNLVENLTAGNSMVKYRKGVKEASTIMNFNQLSWGVVCFYYRLAGDNRYCKIMRDTDFLVKLRQSPSDITPKEFEEKVLLDHVNIENYDLLIGHNLARNVLGKII